MDARSGPRNVSTFVPLLPRILSTRVCTKTRRVPPRERVLDARLITHLDVRYDTKSGRCQSWMKNCEQYRSYIYIYIRYKMLFKELINNEVVDLTNEIIDINIIGWPNI